MRTLLLTLASLILIPHATLAQSTARIVGTVRDPSGAAVPDAAVSAINTQTSLQETRQTAADGTFSIPLLPVGLYKVEISKSGFQKIVRTGISLAVNDNATLDVTLPVGSLSESVTVSAAAPLLETQSGTLKGLVDEQRIVGLPLNGRDVTQLLSIQAGVIPRSTSTGEGNAFAVNGTRGNGVAYSLDGGMNTDSYRNFSGVFPNPDAVQEFSMQKNNFSAEYANASGAVVNVVTKSGTNEFHGSAFHFLRNAALNARNFFAPQRDTLKRNQFGGTLGGPILRNKLFFFFAYQGTILRSDPQLTRQFLPTAAMRGGNFGASRITDPLSRQPFPNNQIPASRLNPVTLNILKFIPTPATPTGERFVGAAQKPDEYEYTTRADYMLGAHRLSGRAFWRSFERPFVGNTADLASMFSADVSLSTQPYTQITLGDIWALSPSLLNNFNFTWRARRTHNDWTAVQLPIDFARAGVKGIAVKNPASVFVGVTGSFTARPGWNYIKDDFDFQFSNNLTWNLGRHELKIGGEFLRSKNEILNDFRTMGNFEFNGSISGNAMADLMLGDVWRFWQGGGEFKELYGNRLGFFVQDNWRLRPTLTLNLGLRWDPTFPFTDSVGRVQCFRPGMRSTRFPNAPVGYLNAGDPGCPEGGFDTYLGTFAPRLGFAFRPGNGRTVLRGGGGVFWNPQFTVLYNGFVNSAPFSPQITNFGVRFEDPYGTGVNPFPASFAPFDPPANSTFVLPLGQLGSFDPSFRPSFMQGYNLTIERELAAHSVLRASYVGNMGRFLSYNADVNFARFAPGATTGNIQSRRPFANYGATLVAGSGSTSSYHALQVSFERRMNRNFSIEANYTWSASIDEFSEDTTPGQSSSIPNPLDRRGNRGRSDFDNPHRFVASYVWTLPTLTNSHRLLRGLFGNWESSGIVTIRNGFPFTVTTGADRSLSGIGLDRPDMIGDANLAAGRSRTEQIARYFNTAAFQLNAPGTFGSATRSLLRGPGAANFDLALLKVFPIKERFRLQYRAEFFNTFNKPNFGSPFAQLSNAARFGRIESAADPRILQMALKLQF
ncbi:MAG: TonB-dependent receptor domain-containing protein [Acidobacteriota bacterium]|jgi:hypothetical protein|nr:TonB-dependent receptor [Bryobacteraceae bacterium CoA2 C42]MCA2962552.1 TonB-dependent receptor [Acidobacteriaceae bacterium]